MLLKWGSNVNYLVEFQIITTVIIGFFVVKYKNEQLGLIAIVSILSIYTNNLMVKNVWLTNYWAEKDAYLQFQKEKKEEKREKKAKRG